MKTFDRPALPALILAVGLALGGWFVGHGFVRGRSASRHVEVKGLAEREVAADLALWPLRFVSTGDDLAVAQAEITRDTREVYSFLARHGIDTAAVQLLALEVSDAHANRFQSERGGTRFVIQQTVMVRSDKPQVVLAASQRVSELVRAGVVLSSSGSMGSAGLRSFSPSSTSSSPQWWRKPPPTPAQPPSSLPPTPVPRWAIFGMRIRAYS